MSVADRFLAWWGAELRALVPAWVKRARHSVFAQIIDDQLHVNATPGTAGLVALNALPEAERNRLARRVRDGRTEVVLLIPNTWIVRQDLSLPATAAKDLSRVLQFEIGRVTPFQQGEIYSTYIAAPSSRTDDQISVELIYTARSGIDPWLVHLQDAGLPASALDIADGPAAEATKPWGLNLLPARHGAGWTMGQRLTTGLAILACGLAIGWFWTVVQSQNATIARLEAVLQDERRALIQVAQATGPASDTAKQAAYSRRMQVPLAVDVLDAVAQILPDGTWISQLSLRGDVIEFSGTSTDATALIALFERHPQFRAPTFRTPVTRSDALETFVMTLQINANGAPE